MLKEILHELGLDPGALVVNIISFLLLLWLMKRYLFAPVGSFLDQRRQQIRAALDSAEAERAAAAAERAELESKRNQTMAAIAEEARAAREAAIAEAEEVKRLARAEARNVEQATRAAMERERQELAVMLRDETAQAAAAMCRKILSSTLTEERHRALLDAFIADLEKLALEQRAEG